MAGAALVGVGLAYGWEERARRYVTEGTLVECLAPWSAPEDWLYLYDPTRKYLWGGLRAVIDALRVW